MTLNAVSINKALKLESNKCFVFYKYMYMGKLINMDKIYCTNVNNK